MTPTKAIKLECSHCKNDFKFQCENKVCRLNNKKLFTLKRIKSYCLTCVLDQNIRGVKNCDGKVLTPEPRICPLHPYGLGHNPKLKGRGNADHLKPYQKTSIKGAFLGVESHYKSKVIVEVGVNEFD